jgi:hypothetical protein
MSDNIRRSASLAEASWEICVMKHALILVAAILLSGCAGHTVYLTGRTTGVIGQSTFRIAHADTVSFTLGKETYTGRWLYMESGGSVGIGTATVISGGQSGAASGVAVGLPTGGNGTYIGSAPDGATLRCTFNFSEWNLKGVGLCVDSNGENYDMQIN